MPATEREGEMLDRYKRALEGLTPGGSEFYDSPERCAEFVRDRLETVRQMLIKAKATPTADTGLAREIAERLVKWQMETGKFLTARSGERAPVIPQSVLERELQDTLSTREQEVGELVEAAEKFLQARPFSIRHSGDGERLRAALDKVRGRG